MILHIIRHGKTDAHLENKRQSPDSPLGEYGKKQAESLASKINLKKIDHVYTSEWPRALETAQIISRRLYKEVKIHPLVHEIVKPASLDNALVDSEINHRYQKEVEANKNDFDWKFDGEGESFNDVIGRGKKMLEYLEQNHASENIIVVSHGIFIAAVTALILLGSEYDRKTFRNLCFNLKIHNTGVSSFEFDPETKRWKMICFNDHGHLENED